MKIYLDKLDSETRRKKMAKGKKCPECGFTCFVAEEKFEPKGSWIVYKCQNGQCQSVKKGYPWKEKVFESNGK
jgi:hypothetical protein